MPYAVLLVYCARHELRIYSHERSNSKWKRIHGQLAVAYWILGIKRVFISRLVDKQPF